MASDLHGRRITTRLGGLDLYVNDEGVLKEIAFVWSRRPAPPRSDHPALAIVERQLQEYVKGERKTFDLSFDADGTEFQRSVWKRLVAIPYGERWTYGDVARALRNRGAARAVGLACAKNPIPLVIPCHRVVGTDGSLTGFGGGIAMKRALLDLERGGRLL
jgi:methylated-DNA-[protein]-cysteine S-methyltransferase